VGEGDGPVLSGPRAESGAAFRFIRHSIQLRPAPEGRTMCGIVGIVGNQNVAGQLYDG
jgi:hypothetical protein